MHWVTRINEALEKNRLILFHQTIKPLFAKQAGVHYEILLRMKDQDGELISPAAFLPAAERYDMMILIDRWVINSAFDFYKQNPKQLDTLSLCRGLVKLG